MLLAKDAMSRCGAGAVDQLSAVENTEAFAHGRLESFPTPFLSIDLIDVHERSTRDPGVAITHKTDVTRSL